MTPGKEPWLRRPIFRLPFTRPIELDVGDELRFHLQGRIEELIASGMSRDEAEAEARRRFGGLERIAREVQDIDESAARRRTLKESVETIAWEVKLAARSLGRRPLFLAVTTATLALAIAANTTVYSALRSVVLRPLHLPDVDRLVVVRQDVPALPVLDADLSILDVMDLNQEPGLFHSAAGWAGRSFNLTGLGDPNRIMGVATVGPFFDVFRLAPALGRFYRPDDSEHGDGRVAVLSHGFWLAAFGGDSAALGSRIQLDDQSYEIIGVLPASMTYPRTGQLFIPHRIQERERGPNGRGFWFMTVIARLHDGVPMGALSARLNDLSLRWHARFGGFDPASGHRLVGQPLIRRIAGELRDFLLVLQAAVVLLLLIACANIGNLHLVRSTERGRELAVRSALGAGSGSIVRHLLLESALVAFCGGVAGVALAGIAIGLLRRLDMPELRALAGIEMDGSVLVYSIAITLAGTLLFGLLPAWRMRRPDLGGLIRESGRGGASGGRYGLKLLRAGAVAQVALSLVLVLGAAALVRSLSRLLAIEPGFGVEHVTTFRLSLPYGSYPEAPRRVATFDDLTARLLAVPGVTHVGYVNDIPFGDDRNSSPFRVRGRPEVSGAPQMHADMRFVHDRYFDAMGIPLQRGRVFQPSDQSGTVAVAVIDQRLADEFFPGEDPLGQTINQGPDALIVGVVGSVKHGTLVEADKATIYYSFRQMSWINTLTAVVRTTGVPLTLNQLQAVVSQVDPRLPVFEVRTMQDRVRESLGPRRLGTVVLTGFGSVSLLLALLGVYGVLSYHVSRQTQELGIRLALGARPATLVSAVTARGLALGGLGLLIGLAGYGVATRLLGSLTYGVSVLDPRTIGFGALVLGAGVAAASFLPARRVVRVDPTEALRQE